MKIFLDFYFHSKDAALGVVRSAVSMQQSRFEPTTFQTKEVSLKHPVTFKVLNNFKEFYLHNEEAVAFEAQCNAASGVISSRCHLRFFFNLGHQTTQYLNLKNRFSGNKNFFETLPTRNNLSSFCLFCLFEWAPDPRSSCG